MDEQILKMRNENSKECSTYMQINKNILQNNFYVIIDYLFDKL